MRYGTGLTKNQILDLLGQDLEVAEGVVNDSAEVDLSQNQFDALVSFCFNVGAGAFQNSTLLRLLNQGDMTPCRPSCAAGSMATGWSSGAETAPGTGNCLMGRLIPNF